MLTNHSWLSLDQSYLHTDEIVPGLSFWKTKVVVHDSNWLTGHSHWPTTREKQRRCALPGCSSRVRYFFEECDVALCIKEHFKTFHTRKWYHLYICYSCSYDVEKYINIWSQSFYSFSCAPHKKNKKTLWPLFIMDGVQLPQGYSHFEEAVYFLPFTIYHSPFIQFTFYLTKQSLTLLNNLVPWGCSCMFKIAPTDH